MKWTPIVGKGFTKEEFRAYVNGLSLPGHFLPQFVVLHNTGVPRLDDWHDVSGEARMKGFEHYYRDVKKWHAGPHLFIAEDKIWGFTPLTESGVHSPSWNSIALGVEMVGDYSTEAFTSGQGAKVRENAIEALAILHIAFNLDSHTLKLHREDPLTTHDCPGKHVDKDDMIKAVHDRIVEMKNE